MAQSCITRTHKPSQIYQLTDTQLRDHLDQLVASEPLRALHLCYELLSHENTWPTRESVRPIVRRTLKQLSHVA